MAFALLHVGAASVFAQSGSATTEPMNDTVSEETDSSRIVYGAEFFAQYSVTTAEDILRRIPGAAAILDGGSGGGGGGGNDSRRGFGSDGDQVLINGRRLAGKSNEISAALRRIQVQNLERIELLRGNTGDVDVRSDGVIVNVVLKNADIATSSGSVMVGGQFDDNGWVDFDGALNYNSEIGRLAYFLTLERKTVAENQMGAFTRRYRDELYFYPSGELMQERPIETNREMVEYTLAANSAYRFERGDTLQINALIKPSDVSDFDVTPFTEYDIDGNPIFSAVDLRSRVVDGRLEWELGGTYERKVGSDGNLKILTVYTHDDTSTIEARNELDGDVLNEVSRNPTDELQTEAILRGSYSWPLSSTQSLEIGAETAVNTLEQTIEIYSDENGDGIAERIDVFNPSSKVEEERSEIFVNHNWTLSDRWTAASSLVAEFSTITQSGSDINDETDFDFVKPRLDLRFAPDAANQWRMKIERTVSQLNFGNFVPEYNIREDRFTAGNPNLRPETAWEYEIGYEHRLDNDEGVIEARVFYNDIQDRIESVAIDVDNDGELDPATGNIGDATEYGYELSFSIRMARIGVPDLILNGRYLHRDTDVRDPFTDVDRIMGMTWDIESSLGLRHDISDWRMSYGITFDRWGGANIRSDWTEFRYFTRTPEMAAFFEKRFGARWTLRFDAFDFTETRRKRTRDVFETGATDGVLRRFEYFEDTRERRYLLSLTSTF